MNNNLSPDADDFTFVGADGRTIVIGIEWEDRIIATSYKLLLDVDFFLLATNTSLPEAYTPFDVSAFLDAHVAQTQTFLSRMYDGAPLDGFPFRDRLSYNAGTQTVSLLP